MKNLVLGSLFYNIGYLEFLSKGNQSKSILDLSKDILKEFPFASQVFGQLSKEEQDILELSDRYAYNLSLAEYQKRMSNWKTLPKKLQSIFSQVALSSVPNPSYYSVQQLSTNIIPSLDSKTKAEDYKQILDHLVSSLKTFTFLDENPNQSYLTLQSIFEKHLSLVSAPLSNEISFYDHVCTMTAIAIALDKSKNASNERLALIQGDFSGIQSFIFSSQGVSNKYVAKTLRAKSFFVSISTQIIAYRICNQLGLPFLSIVMNAGGKFTILAPNSNLESLDKIKESINLEFESMTYGQTKFILAHHAFDELELEKENFSDVFKNLSLKFETAKLTYTPNTIVFSDYINQFTEEKKPCEICGIETGIHQLEKSLIGNNCNRFKEWGEQLPKRNYILLKNLDSLDSSLLDSIELKDEPSKIKPNTIVFSIKESSKYPIKRIANYIPRFSDADSDSSIYENSEGSREEGAIKTFEQIGLSAKEKDKDSKVMGRAFLGILKADIDDLGQLFINGFKTGRKDQKPILSTADKKDLLDRSSLNKISALSRSLDYFFTGWLKDEIGKNDKNVYTVFAGGDDLFLIGNYKEIFELYKSIIHHLKEYTGQNKDIHLSAGIILSKDKVPVYQLKEAVEEELTKSKQNVFEEELTKFKKNSITCFSVTMSNKEYLKLYEKNSFYTKLIEDEISNQYMYKLLTFIQMNENLKSDKLYISQLQNSMWRPLFAYHTHRTLENKQFTDELKKQVNSIPNEIETYSKKLVLPISLALYKYRS